MPATHESEEAEAPFPLQQLVILGLCRLAEPIALISIVSYSFVMVNDIKGPENASFWAGILLSAFAVAEASTAMLWGAISDRVGRKPVILIGLTGTMISCMTFGFAKNYWIALGARVIGGLLNGNIGVLQTMVSEIVKDPKHEPRAYSIQPLAWSVGSIAGSALGGYAAQPARFYPGTFSPDGLFGKYPYLLPNLVASSCMVLAFIQASIFLKETNPVVLRSRGFASDSAHGEVNERTPLRAGRKPSIAEAITQRTRRASYVVTNAPVPNESSFDIRKQSFASVRSFGALGKGSLDNDSAVEDDDMSDTNVGNGKVFNKQVVLWIMALALMCYHHMAFISLFPIYTLDEPGAARPGLDLKGGLGMTVHDVGQYMAVNSLFSLAVQATILPTFMAKVGLWRGFIMITLFWPLIDIAVPFVTAAPNPAWAVYPALFLVSFCNIISYPSLLIMLKNATTSREALGRVNGMAVSASSAARTIAPPLIGLVYSGAGSAVAWWSLSGFGVLAIIEMFFITKPDIKVPATASTEADDA